MDIINLEWKPTRIVPTEWDHAINFQHDEYKLPTIKQLQEAFNQGVKGFQSRYYWSCNDRDCFKDEAWFFDFKQGLPFRSDKTLKLYVRLCKEIKE